MEPHVESQQEAPAAAEAAAEFLNLIGPDELERCLFTETLAVVATGEQQRGRRWLAAQWATDGPTGEPQSRCLLVQAWGRPDGLPGSSNLRAYVTSQLETLEQEEQERLELKPHAIERRTHMVRHQHGMTVMKTLQEGESEPRCWSFSYDRAKMQGLLLEGASLLLLRVLARRQAVPPSLIFPTINTEGHLCTSRYHALGIQQQAVGSVESEVFVIERAIHTDAGISTVWHSSFLPSGHLVRLVQVGCPTVVLLRDESVLDKTDGVKPQPRFPKRTLDWEEDIQLRSWFLDRKETLQASHADYVQQHPELWALLSDFLQALLLRQPQDPVTFAAQFFGPFAHQQPPKTPFTSAGAASPLLRPQPQHLPAKKE